MMKTKDKTIEDTQKNYTKTAKDLNKTRSNYLELEATIRKLKTSLHSSASNQNKDRTRIGELSEEIMKLVKRHQTDEEDKIAFLHELYQRLLSSHTNTGRDKAFDQFAWGDLTKAVYEQVAALVEISQESQDKLRSSVDHTRQRDEAMTRLKADHNEQISRLRAMAREREAAWQTQKEEMERHYTQMVGDAQSRSKANKRKSKMYGELDSVKAERDKMSELCRQHSNVISELNEKSQEFESDKRSVLKGLRRATGELTYAKEREDRILNDIEGAQASFRTLEENIESDRDAHLETKFNSENVQLRVRDLDGAIDDEKSANTEANKAIQRLTTQNRELEQIYEEERNNRKELIQKLDKLEKEHLSVRKQLSAEVEEKKGINDNLARELESHQKNFNELNTQLTKVKKRQQQLEDMYSGSIKKLEFLLHTFHFDDKRLRMANKEDQVALKGKKVTYPAVVVEVFKQMLMTLKRKIDTQSDELNAVYKGATDSYNQSCTKLVLIVPAETGE